MNLREQIKIIIRNSYYSSRDGHDILFEDQYSNSNQNKAAALINKSVSLMSSAKAIYYSNYEDLNHIKIETIFNKFDIFESEFFTNYSTDHSHQWSDIEFREFKKVVTSFIDV